MAVKKKTINKSWQENYAGLILGAIIVVVLGLLVANFFTKNTGEINDGEQITQEQAQNDQKNSETEYKVAAGDSLSKIAEKKYGSMELWTVIAKANNISNPNVIYVDSTLKLPAKVDAEKMKVELTQTSYKVTAGDTLFKIAEKMYGDGSKWTILSKANRGGRLPNGNPLIFADSTLVIPR